MYTYYLSHDSFEVNLNLNFNLNFGSPRLSKVLDYLQLPFFRNITDLSQLPPDSHQIPHFLDPAGEMHVRLSSAIVAGLLADVPVNVF